MFKKSVFQMCDCGNPIIHGHFYFTNKVRTPPIFSLKDGREKLDLAEINGFITSEEKSNLLHDLNGSGIPEDGPDKKAIESYRKKQEEYEKKLNELFSKLGTPLNQAIRIPIASLNAPKE